MRDLVKEFIKNEGMVLPSSFVVEIYSQILRFAGGFAGLIQAGSRKAGESAARVFKEKYKSTISIEEIPQLLTIFFQEAGFGDLKVELDGDKLRVEVIDSPLLRVRGKVESALKPLQGAIEGFLSEMLNKKVSAKVRDKVIEVKI
ncbi:MAG: hypothetical protein GXO39_08615 [Thermotogae bacterium]|nr:hypothetical protein [Thermotogota bacterium]